MKPARKLKNPPLVEVAFEINFRPKMKIFELVPDFQESISEEYPNIAILSPTKASPSENDGPAFQKLERKIQFKNDDDTRIIRVAYNSFNYVDKQYDTFQGFSTRLRKLWKLFTTSIGDLSFTRMGLRYINHIVIPMIGEKTRISSYIEPYYATGRFSSPEIEKANVQILLKKQAAQLHIRSGPFGVLENPKKKYEIYLLDYDCFQNEGDIAREPLSKLTTLHDQIEAQFLKDVKKRYMKYMEGGKLS